MKLIKQFSVSIKTDDTITRQLLTDIRKYCNNNAINFSAHILKLIAKGNNNDG